MSSRSSFFSSPLALSGIAAVVILLAALIPLLSDLPLRSNYQVERHALLEYFGAYLGFCLFFICLRRFHLQRTKDFLFLGLGFLSFVVFQILQCFAQPGFHDFAMFPISANISVGFDLAARIIFGLYFISGILSAKKPLIQPSARNIALIYLNALAFVLFIAVYLFNFLPPVLFVNGQATLLKKMLDLFSAGLVFVAALVLIRRFYRERQPASYWLVLASVFGIFTNIYLALWDTNADVYFDAGHALKIVFITLFLIAILADHIRFLKIEAELRESLEKSKEDLEKSEETFRKLVEKMADGFVIVDKKGALLFSNQAFAKMLGYDVKELAGRHFSLLFDSDNYDRIAAISIHESRIQAGQHEVEMLANEDKRVPVLINAVEISGPGAEYSGIQAVVNNLTERKKIQEDLEVLVRQKTKDTEIFRQCIENSADGIMIADLDGKINYCNGAFQAMTGLTPQELVNRDISVLAADSNAESALGDIWKNVKDGRIWRGELPTRGKKGVNFLGEVSVVPVKDEDGDTVNYLWIERDITRRKALERSLEDYAEELTDKTSELEASKSYYETLISGMSDILLVVDNDGNGTFLNDYGKERLGFNADELTKKNLPIFFDDLKRLEKDYGAAIRIEIKDFEGRINTKNGESILCSWHARPLFDRYNHRIGAMAVGRDITEYKKLQDDLHEYTRNLESKVTDRTSQLRQKVAQLGSLLEIGEEIRLNVDIDVILNKICEGVQSLGWKRVLVSLRDYEMRASRPVAVSGLQPEEIEVVMKWRVPFEHTERYLQEEFRLSNSYFVDHTAELIQENTPYTVHSGSSDNEGDGWHTCDVLLVPIRSKDRILGVISVDEPSDGNKPTVETVRDLEIFSDNAALAIENARLFLAQKQSEGHAKVLAETSEMFYSSLKIEEVAEVVVQKGAEAVGELCCLLLLDDKGEYLLPQSTFCEDPKPAARLLKGFEQYRCPIGGGIIGHVVTSGKPVVGSRPFGSEVNGFAKSPLYYLEQKHSIQSLLIMPLQVRDRRIGAMLYALIKSRRKYKKYELKLARDLADRAALAIENARLFKEAGEKAEELEKANKLKTEFLANVSHELRTPLNAIITLSDILIRGIPGNLNAEQSKQLQIIQRSGRNLLSLINDILDLSKIEAGKVEPIYSVIPIRAVAEETVEHIRPLCLGKGLTLRYYYSEEVPEFIYSDQDKLTMALTNILSNAVKFTATGTIDVSLDVTMDKSKLMIQVTDTGIGIPDDQIDEIFKEFQQIDSSASRTYGGTGLGLAITQSVLKLIGGSVKVESKLGKGSTFTMLLPIKIRKDLVKDETSAVDERLTEEELAKIEFDSSDDRDRLDRRKKHVLVIDDEKEAIYMMRQYLNKNSYQIIFPRNGEDALELARRFNPFAITLDLIMPKRSGWEVLKSLKEDAETRDIPVIVTSILSEQERAYEMGASEYMVKPFEPDKLIEFLGTLDTTSKMKKVVADFPRSINIGRLFPSRVFSFRNKGGSGRTAESKILIVDDDQDTQYAVRYILEGVGYSVSVANNGHEALRAVESIKPDLVLMDIMMPDMDGYEATQKLKSNGKSKNIPIVAMTAKAMKGDRKKAILAGCDDYITKPFMSKEILRVVEKCLLQNKPKSRIQFA